MVNRGMSKADCQAAVTDPDYVTALTDAFTAELMRVIQTKFEEDYVSKFRPSVWCGSLVMQAVVKNFAGELRQHYSEGNALKLEVNGQPVRFRPLKKVATATGATR